MFVPITIRERGSLNVIFNGKIITLSAWGGIGVGFISFMSANFEPSRKRVPLIFEILISEEVGLLIVPLMLILI